MKNLSNLTGDQIIRAVRGKNVKSIVGYCFILLLGVPFLWFAVHQLRDNHDYFWAIASLALGVLFVWMGVKEIGKRMETLRNVRGCKLFRKYGDADTLASVISEGCLSRLVENKQVYVTESFLMRVDNFESFIPYESILLLYKKEHRTNGILDGIFLVAHDAYGDSYEYPFKLGKKYAGDFELAAGEIVKRAPQVRIGYTQENLAYVKALQKEI